MAKLLLIQTLFLTICWFAFVSGKIEHEEEFKKFIRGKVVPTFRKWAKHRKDVEGFGGEQFAVLMLMDTDKDWDKFTLLPKPKPAYKKGFIVQPKQRHQMKNYVAVLPGSIKKGGDFLHSEQRIYEDYLKHIWNKYKADHYDQVPKAMVLYSWIVPCIEQSCPSEGTSGCTKHTMDALKDYTDKTKVIVAYTTKGGGTSKSIKCNAAETKLKLENAGIDVINVDYKKEEEQEAMMESLIKLGRFLQILE